MDQTYCEWECIIVDDGSTDHSKEKINDIAKLDNRITTIFQENKGVSSARNQGFLKATGEFIQFLDGDDFLAPEKLEIQVDFMEDNTSVDVCYTNHKHYFHEKKIAMQYSFQRLNGNPLNQILYGYDNGVSIPIHTALFRRNIWKQDERPFRENYNFRYEDWIFWVEIALKGANFKFTDYDMAFYRIHKDNFCGNANDTLTNALNATDYISRIIPSELRKSFLDEKKIFFISRYQKKRNDQIRINKYVHYLRKIKNKVGSIKRGIECSFEENREKRYRLSLQEKVINKNFTIISNNCWGGGIYQDLDIPYQTPTVGLFFFPECYVKFISNLEWYLSLPLSFISKSKYQKANDLRDIKPYPIGILNNEIEIHFLHYFTRSEAYEKWNKRKERINFKNLFLSFTDNEKYTDNQLESFSKSPYRKVFFSSKDFSEYPFAVQLKKYTGKETVGDIYTERWAYRNDFDVAKWLNEQNQ